MSRHLVLDKLRLENLGVGYLFTYLCLEQNVKMSKASANHRRSFLILQRSIHPQVPMLRLPIFHAVEHFKQKSFAYSIKLVSDGL